MEMALGAIRSRRPIITLAAVRRSFSPQKRW
jgi:hypothetical protein